jgi:Holliday junction DNA helicase RuvB
MVIVVKKDEAFEATAEASTPRVDDATWALVEGILDPTTDEPEPEALRPRTLADFSGQNDLTRELGIIIAAAKTRGESPGHILLAGPAGLGKTTLAGIIAHETSHALYPVSGPSIERPGELYAILSDLPENSCLFIDEIHRLPKSCEEALYTAMEDRYIDFIIGEGSRAHSVRVHLEPFILLGATTQAGLLSAPLRDRFSFTARLRPYDLTSLTTIVMRSSRIMGVNVGAGAAEIIASRSQGTPRIANRLLGWVRDYASVTAHAANASASPISTDLAGAALVAFGIDELGLDQVGRDILNVLLTSFAGGPVGLNTLAASVGEDPLTLATVYEPHLMSQGLLQRTPRGRIATALTWEHLGKTPPASFLLGAAPALFPEGTETA